MIKAILTILIIFLLQIESNSQNCVLLDSLNSFHGLKFGEDIKQSKAKSMTKLLSDIYYFEELNKKSDVYFNLTHFLNHSFDDIYISCTKERKIYSFRLKSYLTEIDSLYLKKNKMPASFERLFENLENIYGNYTNEKIKKDTITFLLGDEYIYTWECQRVKIICSINIGNKVPTFNGINLEIVDKELERKAKIESIQED